MNPLLFANLSNQRRLLRSGTAYELPRIVVNLVFSMFALLSGLGFLLWTLSPGGVIVFQGAPGLPDWWLFALRASLIVGLLLYAGAVCVGWMTVRAFFDIADACIATTCERPEEPVPAPKTIGV